MLKRALQFVRVDYQTDPALLFNDLLIKEWNLDTPKLLISVTGGAKKLKVKPRHKGVIGRGLMKAAESTGV